MAKFVLVHGAFQGGWVWKDVVKGLREAGHEAHAPTLSGCGYLEHGMVPGMDLHAYVKDVLGYLEEERLEDAILVAHSYSGMVCGGVLMTLPRDKRRLISVDAAIPDSDKCFAGLAGEPFRQMLEKHRLDSWRIKPWGLPVFGVEGEKGPWFQERLRPFPMEAFERPFPGAFDPASVRAIHISCRDTAAPFIRKMADKAITCGWPLLTMDGGHCPMVMRPEELTGLLMDAAERI